MALLIPMSDAPSLTTLALLSLLLGSPVVGIIVQRFMRPQTTPLELLQEIQEERNGLKVERDQLKSDLAAARTEIAAVRSKCQEDIATVKAQMEAGFAALRADLSEERTNSDGLRDYAHRLRKQISDLNHTPEPWPEGVSL